LCLFKSLTLRYAGHRNFHLQKVNRHRLAPYKALSMQYFGKLLRTAMLLFLSVISHQVKKAQKQGIMPQALFNPKII